jgi:hypothetical protein
VRRYEEPRAITWDDALHALASSDVAAAARALVSLALTYPDGAKLESLFVRTLQDPRSELRSCAATCLGHVARIHKSVGKEAVAALRALEHDPSVGGVVSDAIEDIEMFARRVTRG